MANTPQPCKQCGTTIYFDGLCVACRAENKRAEILALSEQEVEAMIDQLCANIEKLDDNEDDSELCNYLINYRDINTEKIAIAAWEQQIFFLYRVYKDAPVAVIKDMITLLGCDDTPSLTANRLLLCLAAAGGEQVFEAFLELEKNPRKWREKLHVNPSYYANYGGWSYDEDGNFVKTMFDKCYPMVKGTLAEKEKSPVKIGGRTDEVCPHCGCGIVNLIELDGRDARLDFLGIDGIIKAKCCPNCFPYLDGGYCRYTVNGDSEIIPYESSECENCFEDEDLEAFFCNTYVLGEHPVPPRYAADWEGGSAVGGFGFWIQDCDIKHCPDCGKHMTYLAQIQWDTVLEFMEGNAYIEICKDCRIMAVLHQQT